MSLHERRQREGRRRHQRAIDREIRSEKRSSGRKAFESFERRLLRGRDRSLGQIGNAVSTAGARFMSSIGEKRLAMMELNLAVGPENFAAQAIRNVDGAVAVEGNDAGRIDFEVGIVSRDDRIVPGRGEQLLRVFNPAGNDRIGVEAALRRERIGHRDGDTFRAWWGPRRTGMRRQAHGRVLALMPHHTDGNNCESQDYEGGGGN